MITDENIEKLAIQHGADIINGEFDGLIYFTGEKLKMLVKDAITSMQTEQPKLDVQVRHMKESNGNEWWTVNLSKGTDAKAWDGYDVYQDKIKGRADYEADKLRHFLGLIDKAPFILDYNTDAPAPVTSMQGDSEPKDSRAEFDLVCLTPKYNYFISDFDDKFGRLRRLINDAYWSLWQRAREGNGRVKGVSDELDEVLNKWWQSLSTLDAPKDYKKVSQFYLPEQAFWVGVKAAAPNDEMAELERALAVIGVVGKIDGHDVIRRESVLNIARDRIKRSQPSEHNGDANDMIKPPVDEWLTIETAPIGVNVDLWVTCKGWSGSLKDGRRECDYHLLDGLVKGWRKTEDLHYYNMLHASYIPTHWRHAPVKPAIDKAMNQAKPIENGELLRPNLTGYWMPAYCTDFYYNEYFEVIN